VRRDAEARERGAEGARSGGGAAQPGAVRAERAVPPASAAAPATTLPLLAAASATRRPRASRGATLALVAGLAAAALLACAAPLAAQQLTTVRIPLASVAAVDSVRRLGIDVVEWRRAPDGVTALAVIAPRDAGLLATRGWNAVPLPREPLPAAMEAQRAALGAAAYAVFRDFDDPARGVVAYLRAFAASHANVAVDSVGASWQGRPMLAVKVGPAGDGPTRPNVIFVATYHAREWAATEMALRLIRFLADSLPARPGGAALLASRDVWVIPVANPDGYEYTFTTERLWRKNRRANGDGSFGVDLNRNHTGFFAFDDEGSSPAPLSEIYRGPAAESEPETRAIAAFHRAHPPVVAVSYHTYADAILYPWGHAAGLFTGDQAAFTALVGTPLRPAALDSVPGSSKTGYTPGPSWSLYPTNGDYDEWAYREFGALAFTAEITAGCCLQGGGYYGFEFPDDEVLLGRVFRDNLPLALAAIAAAGGPGAGLRVADSAFVSLWPRAVVTAPAAAGSLTLDYASAPGAARSGALTADSLGSGRYGTRYGAADPALAGAVAARVARLGLAAEVVARDGAEWDASPWRGFMLDADAAEGARSWYTPGGVPAPPDLVSPDFAVAGRTGLRLSFWTKHSGSLFDSVSVGRVEVSTDRGATWTEVWRVAGASSAWYPVTVPLGAAGAAALRLRFRTASMPWWIDAIVVTADGARILDSSAVAQGNPLTVNANPVRTAPLVVRWPAGSGNARAQVFSYYGSLVAEETLAGDPGLWRWDLATRSGEALANGAYIVVVTRGDGVRYRRRVFVLRGGS
jgi:hypothetical protein